MNPLIHPRDWLALQEAMGNALPAFLFSQRWFGGKARTIRSMEIVDAIPIPLPAASACIFLQRVEYGDGTSETYVIPLLERESSGQRGQAADGRPSLRIQMSGEQHLLSDALWERAFLELLLEAFAAGRRFPGANGELRGRPTRSFESLLGAAEARLEPSLIKAEQSNSSVLYGRSLVLKFFRRIERGINPDCEIGEFLSQRAAFSHVPAVAGALEYWEPTGQTSTVGILQAFIANQGDAWQQSLRELADYYDRVEKGKPQIPADFRRWNLLTGTSTPPSPLETDLLGKYRGTSYLLGQRTAELHKALASHRNNADFAPERFSQNYQLALCESMSGLTEKAMTMLRERVTELPPGLREKADSILYSKARILEQFHVLRERPLTGLRTRVHGDFHLGQVLCAEDDFVFIDFEGEPVRTLAERREKHSPLRDVAGMVRSFHYAAFAALFQRLDSATAGAETHPLLPFANIWYAWAATEYLRGYLETASRADFLPATREELQWLLNVLLLEKAVYELKYELSHRLSWVRISLEGIHQLVSPTG